jgi:hypothetical protein
MRLVIVSSAAMLALCSSGAAARGKPPEQLPVPIRLQSDFGGRQVSRLPTSLQRQRRQDRYRDKEDLLGGFNLEPRRRRGRPAQRQISVTLR